MHSIIKFACLTLGFGLIVACDPGEAATARSAELSSFCGGIAGIECPKGEVCVDDPNDDCDPNNGGADCGGFCEAPSSFCGGIAGIECPKGEVCVDDPNDDCDPEHGGADCGGVCEPEGDKCDIPGRKYVTHDPQECMLVKFACPKGWSMFSDDCGCGCEKN